MCAIDPHSNEFSHVMNTTLFDATFINPQNASLLFGNLILIAGGRQKSMEFAKTKG